MELVGLKPNELRIVNRCFRTELARERFLLDRFGKRFVFPSCVKHASALVVRVSIVFPFEQCSLFMVRTPEDAFLNILGKPLLHRSLNLGHCQKKDTNHKVLQRGSKCH